MGNKFTEVERKYRSLLQSYEEGSLDAEQFAQALEDLKLQDEQEQWWQIQGNGKWLRFNDEVWEEAVPPRPMPPPPPRSALIPPPRHARGPSLAQTPVIQQQFPGPSHGTDVGDYVSPASAGPAARAQKVQSDYAEPIDTAEEVPVTYSDLKEPDDSIFFQTGVPAEQIPGLNNPEPAPAAFLLDKKDVRQAPQPIPPKPHLVPLATAPDRPQEAAVIPSSQPAVAAAPQAEPAKPIALGSAPDRPQVAALNLSPQPRAAAPAPPAAPTHATPPPSISLGHGSTPPTPTTGQSLTCPNCHRKALPGAHFCKYCGSKPVEAPAPAPQVQTPPSPSCPACREPVLPNAKFCGKCGHAMGIPLCPKCQVATLPGARFCKNCGQKLS